MKKLILFSVIFVLFSGIAISQNVNVSPGGGSYATLKAAFDAINAGTHTGAITIDIVNNTSETAPCVLNASGSGSANYTSISISPSGGSFTVSGAITAGSPLIDLNGADNVTIDGLNTGGNALTISNTTVSATSGTSTIRFINGATNNVITNCSVLGSFSATVITNGGTIFFSTDGSTASGNDNNTISYCNIGPAGSNLPTKGIFGNGSQTTTAIGNSGILITNNNIYDYFGAAVTSAGIYVANGCNNWTISNNKFYQTATRTWTTGAQHSAIWLLSSTATYGAQGMIVTGNTIGYSSSGGTGTYTLTGSTGKFIGVFLSAITGATLNRISNNIFNSISLTGVTSSGTGSVSPFTMIYIGNGLANTDSNSIGSQSATGNLTFSTNTTTATDVTGIYNFSVDVWNARNNIIGGITANNAGATGAFIFYGLRANTSTSVSFTATNNIIGGTVANSIQNNSTSTTSQSICMLTANAPAVWTSNTIRNVTGAGGTGTTTSASVIGMSLTTTSSNHTVSQNTIHSLSNTNSSGATTVCGIQYTGGTGTNLVERNFIHSFSGGNANAILNGINVSGGTTTYRNNMIRLGIDKDGNSLTTGMTINGINEPLGTDNFYFNSVYIGGTGVGGSNPTYAFNSTQTVNTRVFQNNIFWNARSNGSGTGKHYAVRVGGTAPNPTGLTINYNVYYASGTGAVFGFFNSADVADLAAWKTAVGQDANSISGYDPQFINPTGTSSTVDLHIHPTNPTVIEGSGLAIGSVTDDFDGQTRSGLTPTDIGADAGNFVAQDVSGPVITYTPLGNTSGTGDRTLIATITDPSGVPTSGDGLPVLYWKINAGSYTSVQGSLSSPNNYSFTFGSGVNAGDVVSYYIVAQDEAGTPNVSCYPSAGAAGFSASPPAVSTPPSSPSTYSITTAYSGTYNVGTSETITSLTGAGGFFSLINGGVVSGDVTVYITSDITEDGTNALNQWSEEGGSGFTITIQPDGETERLISGAVSNGMIRLNGADRVTVDGRFSGSGRYLRFRNTNTSNPTFTFISDATNNTIRDCYIEGATTSASNGVIFFSTGVTTGNDNNTITSNIIRDRSDASGVPANCIYSAGTSGAISNGANEITYNEIFNFTGFGVNVSSTGNGDGWKVNNNFLYQTAARTTALSGIYIGAGNNHEIHNNSIGGSAADRSGEAFRTSLGLRGIDLSVGVTTPTSVQGNTISNFGTTGSGTSAVVIGLNISAGLVNVGTSTGNTFGGGNQPYDTIRNGYDNGIINMSGGTVTIENNTIGNITYWGASGDRTAGIYVSGGTATVRNNTVRDINHNGTGTAFSFLPVGIYINVSGIHTVEKNTVYNIRNTNLGTGVYTAAGIIIASASSGTNVAKNRIYDIKADGINAALYGIYVTSGSTTYSNNQISVGTGMSDGRLVKGIQDVGTGTNTYYYNSVYVGGANTSGSTNSHAFLRSSTATVTLRNNVFYNERTGGTGFHYAIGNTAGTPATGWSATASNYNLFVVTDASRMGEWGSGTGRTFAEWKTSSSGDAYSYANLNTNVPSANIFSNTAIGNLNVINTNSECWSVKGKGTPLTGFADDFGAAAVRSTTVAGGSTCIGSDEFTTSTTPPATSASAPPANNTTTNYTAEGRQIVSIAWGDPGSVPTSLDVVYYPGSIPPGTTGFQVGNCYWQITPTGGSGFTYDITFNYDEAQLGNISSEANLRLTKSEDGVTYNSYLVPGTGPGQYTLNTTNNTITVYGLTSFSFFGLQDVDSPLPVELASFSATVDRRNVNLKWSTSAEVNNKGFDIERKDLTGNWNKIGYVNGSGNSTSIKNYSFEDRNLQTGKYNYRLKQIDNNGNFKYHELSGNVQVGIPTKYDLSQNYPNPFNPVTKIDYDLPFDSKVIMVIYDISGREIKRLVNNEVKTAGYYTVELNGSNLASGIYFYRMIAEGNGQNFTMTKKMALVK